MSKEFECGCGIRPATTDVWKDIPDKCDTCGKQVLIRNTHAVEKTAPWKDK